MTKHELGNIITGIITYIYIDGDKYVAECDKRTVQKAIDILRFYWQFEQNDKKGRQE